MAMEEMKPEEMAMMQKQKGMDNSQNVTGLIQQVGQGMAKLAEMVNQLPQATPDARSAIMSAMEAYAKAIEVLQGGGEQEEPEAEAGGAVPMEGGARGVPMGPQARQ